eukprot:SAG11_NODE_18165_length_498_cov_0.962406_1_plen_86_part_10
MSVSGSYSKYVCELNNKSPRPDGPSSVDLLPTGPTTHPIRLSMCMCICMYRTGRETPLPGPTTSGNHYRDLPTGPTTTYGTYYLLP